MKNIFVAALFAIGLSSCGTSGGDSTRDSTTLQSDTLNTGGGLTTDTAPNNSIDTGGMLNDTSRADRTRRDTSNQRRSDTLR